jgi:hypothetical protein
MSTPRVKIVPYHYRGNNPIFLARGPNHITNRHWRVYINGTLQSGQFPTFAEADAYGKRRAAELTLPCPKCGHNVIGNAVTRAYRDGKPSLLCPCGTWVAR